MGVGEAPEAIGAEEGSAPRFPRLSPPSRDGRAAGDLCEVALQATRDGDAARDLAAWARAGAGSAAAALVCDASLATGAGRPGASEAAVGGGVQGVSEGSCVGLDTMLPPRSRVGEGGCSTALTAVAGTFPSTGAGAAACSMGNWDAADMVRGVTGAQNNPFAVCGVFGRAAKRWLLQRLQRRQLCSCEISRSGVRRALACSTRCAGCRGVVRVWWGWKRLRKGEAHEASPPVQDAMRR